MSDLPEPKCRLGYPWTQISTLLDGKLLEGLEVFLVGQTMAICEGGPERTWIDDPTAPGGMRLVEVGPPLCSEAHGTVVYPWDLARYIGGKPVID